MAWKILISGASGFVGESLRVHLEQRQAVVTQLVRHAAEGPNERHWSIADQRIEFQPDDAFDVVIHLAGAGIADRRWSSGVRRELIESRIQSTQLLVEGLAGLHKHPNVMLSASAIGIYGANPDGIVDERSPPGEDFLSTLCLEWEAASQAVTALGVRLVNPRLGVVLGKSGGMLQRVVPLFQRRVGGRLGNGAQWLSWIAMQDLLRAIDFVIENEAIEGPVNFCSPHWVTNEEFTKALQTALYVGLGIPAPAAALKIALGKDMAEQTVLASQQVRPQVLLEHGFQFEVQTIADAIERSLRDA